MYGELGNTRNPWKGDEKARENDHSMCNIIMDLLRTNRHIDALVVYSLAPLYNC